jgi:uncharacterized OsmC-like protein
MRWQRESKLELLENRYVLSGASILDAQGIPENAGPEHVQTGHGLAHGRDHGADFQVPGHRDTIVKPIHVTGDGVVATLPVEGPSPWTAAGTSTQLGKYTAAGGVEIDEFTSDTTANFSSRGPAVFTAANGDEIHFEFAGEITLREDGSTVWIATFVPLKGSGTGRFAKVTGGSLVMTAHGEPVGEDGSVPFSWDGVGELEYARPSDRPDHRPAAGFRHDLSPRSNPFKVAGDGAVATLPVDGPSPWTAAGTATQLGKYTAAGGVEIDEFTSETTANFSSRGPAVFTAANGDEIHFEFAGEITLREDGTTVWIATFVPLEGSGTGRLAKVVGGSFVMTAYGEAVGEDGSVPFAWNGIGELEFARGPRGPGH